ncbi:MAG TPA: ComEC/Rec2 family competence protein, partial [Sphingorhabdus sp.]|nr:ComEC/Rec2 family competence protein [Sphingorhabdus sp.]
MQFAIDEPISITADHSGGKWFSPIENWLEFEQERLPLLIPVALGLGISIWQVFGAEQGLLVASACAGAALLGLSIGPSSRLKGLMLIGALLLGLGYGAITFKSSLYGAAPLERPWIGRIHGRVESIEDVSARDIVRYRIYVGQHPELPRIIRVNIDKELASPDIAPGSVIEFKVRLMPPPGPALPGSYDFARAAWFGGIGATGRILGPVRIISPPLDRRDFWNNARNALSMRIQMAMGAETGPVGSALLVGTRGSIEDADAEALRNSGMAHLLSVSGLHVTAVVGGTFMLVASLLALWPWLALRVPVPLAAAACAAIIAVLYTLLTGAEVPTVRACIAALLILVALAMGRDALSLRLLAAGATFVLLFWPEALAGPSFQLSFAAVGTIIILHDSTWMRQWMQRRDERLFVRLTRQLSGLLLTGLAIELVLAPIALFHFHKSGLYGALANIAAIP